MSSCGMLSLDGADEEQATSTESPSNQDVEMTDNTL